MMIESNCTTIATSTMFRTDLDMCLTYKAVASEIRFEGLTEAVIDLVPFRNCLSLSIDDWICSIT